MSLLHWQRVMYNTIDNIHEKALFTRASTANTKYNVAILVVIKLYGHKSSNLLLYHYNKHILFVI